MPEAEVTVSGIPYISRIEMEEEKDSIKHIKQIMTNGGQPAISVGIATLAPVVVIAETTVNNKSIGTMFEIK